MYERLGETVAEGTPYVGRESILFWVGGGFSYCSFRFDL